VSILFSVNNHQCEDSGPPPELPADFDSPRYWKSYFENKYGEQWLCYYDRDEKQLVVRGGDCGWEKVLEPFRISVDTLCNSTADGLEQQFLLAGKALVPQLIAGEPKGLITVWIDKERGTGITLNSGENIWLDACLDACGFDVPMKNAKEFEEYLDKCRAIVGEEDDED